MKLKEKTKFTFKSEVHFRKLLFFIKFHLCCLIQVIINKIASIVLLFSFIINCVVVWYNTSNTAQSINLHNLHHHHRLFAI